MPGVVSSIFGNFLGGGSPFGGQQPGGSPFGIFGGGQNPFAAGSPTTPMPAQPMANLSQANPFGGLADAFANMPQSPYNGHVDRMSAQDGYKTRHMLGGASHRRGDGGSDPDPALGRVVPGQPATGAAVPGSNTPQPQGPLAGNQMVQNWQPIQRYNFGGRRKGGQDYRKGVATRPTL